MKLLLSIAILASAITPLLAVDFNPVILCYRASNGKFYNITVPSYEDALQRILQAPPDTTVAEMRFMAHKALKQE